METNRESGRWGITHEGHVVLAAALLLLGNLLALLHGLLGLVAAELNAVVLQVPLAEGGGIDSNHGALDESLGTDKLVVGGVVGHIEHTGGLGDGLGTPGEGAVVKAEGAVLDVAATDADRPHALNPDPCVGSSPAESRNFSVSW